MWDLRNKVLSQLFLRLSYTVIYKYCRWGVGELFQILCLLLSNPAMDMVLHLGQFYHNIKCLNIFSHDRAQSSLHKSNRHCKYTKPVMVISSLMRPEDTDNMHLINVNFLRRTAPTLIKDSCLGAWTVYICNKIQNVNPNGYVLLFITKHLGKEGGVKSTNSWDNHKLN